jgi:preprotein translocase subunit YajC
MFGVAFAMGQAPGGAAAGGGNQAFMQLIPLVLMFGIFYFLLIRPQQKKAKEHRALLDGLKKGDQVVTAGGIHGKVTAVEETFVMLEVATGVNIRISKNHVASVIVK